MYNSDYNRPPEEREPIETEHFHVWDAESPKPPRKKSGAARFVALGLCCALVGGLVGGGGVLAASHLSGIYVLCISYQYLFIGYGRT